MMLSTAPSEEREKNHMLLRTASLEEGRRSRAALSTVSSQRGGRESPMLFSPPPRRQWEKINGPSEHQLHIGKREGHRLLLWRRSMRRSQVALSTASLEEGEKVTSHYLW